MWVQVKATGDMLEINLDKDRPVKFDSKDAEVCETEIFFTRTQFLFQILQQIIQFMIDF